jgi:hypothetical protein
MEIEIFSTPPGEAPEEVRRMWIGLRLPLLVEGSHKFQTVGALTGPKTWLGNLLACIFGKTTPEVGYAVNSSIAISILESKNSMAANWWKENTTYYSNLKRIFIFNKECCRVVEENS